MMQLYADANAHALHHASRDPECAKLWKQCAKHAMAIVSVLDLLDQHEATLELQARSTDNA